MPMPYPNSDQWLVIWSAAILFCVILTITQGEVGIIISTPIIAVLLLWQSRKSG